ncbi:MAG: hypothetical protein AAFV45_08325 [Pseudomonadota bacterium]
MQFTRADMLRLLGLYVLTFVAATAVAISVARSFPVDIRLDVLPIAGWIVLLGCLVSQRNVLAAVMPGGLTRWSWWSSFLLGLVLVVTTTLTIAMFGLIVFTLPGAPLAEWWSENGTALADQARAAAEAPVFSGSGGTSFQIAVWSFFVVYNLLLFWPLGNLLSRKTSRPGRGYIMAMAATSVLAAVLPLAVLDYGPPVIAESLAPVTAGFTEPAVFAILFLIAIIAAIVSGLLMSWAFFALSEPQKSGPAQPDTQNPSEPEKTKTAQTDPQPPKAPAPDADPSSADITKPENQSTPTQ